MKYLLAGLLIAGLATPALAAGFYAAQRADTNKCVVVAKKPNGKKLTMLVMESFATKPEAKEAMKSMPECNS
jgi:septal ring-binding cell division protein DamX